MAALLQVQNAHKAYADQVLLDGADATLVEGAKVGFIGRNGAGKSTLLQIMLGQDDLDAGDVIQSKRLRVGYLRQHDPFNEGESALDFLMRDSGQPDWKCGEVAAEFELKGAYLEGPVKSLSGGWQTRVKLAALLLHDPNLLILDEPTNFLDLRTQILLEHFLRNFRGAALIVSHDRGFLRSTCEHTLELARGKLTMYQGKIDAFLQNRDERLEHDRRVNATVATKQKQLERFIAKNRANASTASQAKSKAKQLDRLKLTELEVDEPTVNILAPRVERRSGPAVRCTDLSIGYPDHTVASDVALEIEHGDRAAIVGDNGQGKTTFLRTLVDSLPPISGEVRWGHHCKIGTYAQHVYTSLPEDKTVIEYLEYQALPGTPDQEILKIAGSLLFRDSHIKKKIKVLSGGERARLCMASILLGDFNILVLDEPGNHLDVETVEALSEALINYQGTVIFTSHDRYFTRRIATSVIEVRDGRVRNYNGGYDAYEYSVNKEIDEGERARHEAAGSGGKRGGNPGGNPGGGKSVEGDPGKVAARKMRDDRKIRKQISSVEKKIARLDEEKRATNEQLLQTTDAEEALTLHKQVEEIGQQLEEAENRWLELQEDL